MPIHFIRPLLIATFVLGSFGTLTDAALAEETTRSVVFSCTVPMIGAERCGDNDQNIRVGPEKRLTVDWTVSGDPKACVTFHVYHAVSNDLLKSVELCNAPTAAHVWPNPDKKTVDVYVKVSSTRPWSFNIKGFYNVNQP